MKRSTPQLKRKAINRSKGLVGAGLERYQIAIGITGRSARKIEVPTHGRKASK